MTVTLSPQLLRQVEDALQAGLDSSAIDQRVSGRWSMIRQARIALRQAVADTLAAELVRSNPSPTVLSAEPIPAPAERSIIRPIRWNVARADGTVINDHPYNLAQAGQHAGRLNRPNYALAKWQPYQLVRSHSA